MAAFRDRVARCDELPDDALEPGLRALRGGERSQIKPTNSRSLEGSVDLDTSLKAHPSHAQASRWDYAVGYDGQVWFIEFHPVSDGDASVVGRKADWLDRWLDGPGRPLAEIASGPYYWIATGGVPPARQRKKVTAMAQRGVRMVGSSLTLPPGQ